MKLVIKKGDGLQGRLFLFVVAFPLVSYAARVWALDFLDEYSIALPFVVLLKFIVVLLAMYAIIGWHVQKYERRDELYAQRVFDSAWKLAAYFFIVIAAASSAVGLFHVSNFFSPDVAIAIALLMGNVPLTVLLVVESTFLGNKGALFFLIIFLFLRDGISRRQMVFLISSLALLPFLYLLGRVASASVILEGQFDLSSIIELFRSLLSKSDTYLFLIDSMSKRLNQYDGVEFGLQYGQSLAYSALDPQFLLTRVVDSFTPFGSSVPSFGSYIGRQMLPEIDFARGYAGALGILGQIAVADLIDIIVLMMITFIMTYLGLRAFSRLPGRRVHLLFASLAFSPVLISGNMDSVVVLFLRLLFGIAVLRILSGFFRAILTKSIKVSFA